LYNKYLLLTALILLLPGSLFAQKNETNEVVLRGPYLGQTPPGLKAEIFAPGIASTGLHDDMGPAFSPDGSEVFFRIAGYPYGIITTMKQVDGVWSKPDLAFWSGQYADSFVFFSHDGEKLYFASRRPVDGKGKPEERYAVWEVERSESGYGIPKQLGSMLGNEETVYLADLSNKGNFFMNHEVTIDGNRTFETYSCQLEDGKFVNPQKIDLKIDPRYMTFAGTVDPDEKYMIMSIRNMEDSLGSDDLYVSFHKEDGSWGTPIHLDDRVNSANGDGWPRISPDGKYLFFVSWRYEGETYSEKPVTYDEIIAKKKGHIYGWGADIYWVSTEVIAEHRQ